MNYQVCVQVVRLVINRPKLKPLQQGQAHQDSVVLPAKK